MVIFMERIRIFIKVQSRESYSTSLHRQASFSAVIRKGRVMEEFVRRNIERYERQLCIRARGRDVHKAPFGV
jgi:hypothetical protein